MRHSSSWGGSSSRRGFTLVEMMIALVITLMIVFAMVEAFRWVGEATTDGRASIEMLGQIRHARFRLEDDLSRCTAALTPWGANARLSQGYFELVEGMESDYRAHPAIANSRFPLRYIDRSQTTSRSSSVTGSLPSYTLPAGYNECVFNDTANPVQLAIEHESLFGDVDDVLMFTARNDDVPYRGRYVTSRQAGADSTMFTADDVLTTVIIESNLAEIFWWTELNDANGSGGWDPGETFVIRRRVLLIRPDLNSNGLLSGHGTSLDYFLRDNDVSVRPHYDESRNFVGIAANSLGDLCYRHNRTAHQPANYAVQRPVSGLSQEGYMWPLKVTRLPVFATSDLLGEDVVLTNVLAFDFRVWDPAVPVMNYEEEVGVYGNEGLVPGDFGYGGAAGGAIVGSGGYIDLGATATAGQFVGAMNTKAYLATGEGNSVYDPWTLDYESDNFNQDQDTATDEGTNGIDDDSSNGPDDTGVNTPTVPATHTYPGERETSPPYPSPLTSIQVRIRMYEPDTRQVRQASQVVKFRAD